MKKYINPSVQVMRVTPAAQVLGASNPVVTSNQGIVTKGNGGQLSGAM